MDYVMKLALEQKEEEAHILDVNMGLPDIDEPTMLTKAIKLKVMVYHVKISL